ncbi:MAG: BatA domain-containing protein [Phycisphaerae bacterium]
MNVIFLHPELLILAPVVAVGGWLLLRKAPAPELIFPILEFWPEETPQSAGRQKRFPDWPWVLILAAAVLSAIALSSPRLQWRAAGSVASPSAHLFAIARSLPGNPKALDVFVKVSPIHSGSDYILVSAAHHQVIRRAVSAAAGPHGFDIAPVPAAPIVVITLTRANRVLARMTLLRAPGIRKIAAHFIGVPPPDFLRLLTAIPAITFHGGILQHGLWIIQQRHFNPKLLSGITHSAVVLLGDTPGPGLWPRAALMLKRPQTPVAVSQEKLMRFVNASGIMVKKLLQARLDPQWYPLMEVDSHPWLAQRDDVSRHITWLWLAGQANSSWNTWPHHASFVIFFANVIAQLQTLPGAVKQGRWWRSATPPAVSAYHASPITTKAQMIHVNIPLAAVVCACLLAAVFGLINTNRNAT